MNDDFNDLIEKFLQINNLGYVKGVSNNLVNAAGLTFEYLLGKKADSNYLPDYKSIEIKCTQRFSRHPITLFTLSFDGPTTYESNYLLETYGKPDAIVKDKRILVVDLELKEKVLVYNKYFFELNIDYIENKLLINIFDKNMNYIESRGFISLDVVRDRIDTKLKNLAIIYASKKNINENLFFRYYQIICCSYKGFNNFLNLIESGDIRFTLLLRVGKTERDFGKNKNKNMVFQISKNSISKLFDILYSYED